MQSINIINKDEIKINNVSKIIEFDPSHFLIETSLGNIKIIGSNLTMDNINVEDGLLIIKGIISGVFLDDIKKKKESFFKKLIK